MDCRRAEELLFERTERSLPAETGRRLLSHCDECTRCREFAHALGAAGQQNVGAEFTAGVLALTSAREPLARALRQLDLDLPTLATMTPDDDFVGDVMAATVVADHRRLGYRLQRFWEQLVERPRLAVEASYVAAMALFLLVGMPWSPLAGMPQQALTALQEGSAPVRSTLAEGGERIERWSAVTWERAGDAFRYRPAVDAAVQPRASWRERLLEWSRGVWNRFIAPGLDWLVAPWRDQPPTDSLSDQRTLQEDDDDDRTRHSV